MYSTKCDMHYLEKLAKIFAGKNNLNFFVSAQQYLNYRKKWIAVLYASVVNDELLWLVFSLFTLQIGIIWAKRDTVKWHHFCLVIFLFCKDHSRVCCIWAVNFMKCHRCLRYNIDAILYFKNSCFLKTNLVSGTVEPVYSGHPWAKNIWPY